LDALYRYRAFAPANERETLDRRMKNIEQRLAEELPTQPVSSQASARREPRGDGGARTFPIVMLSVGAAGITSGTIFGLNALHARSEASGDCVRITTGDVYCSDRADGALHRDRLDSLLADVSFGVGVLGLGIGTVTALHTSVDVSLAPGGVILGATF
jgi:hypothetical protein